MNIATNLEQSKRLLELGIDPSTADMFYTSLDNHCVPWVWSGKPFLHIKDVPAWSLSALLDVLPFPQLSKDKLGSGKIGWMVSVYPDNCRYDSCWHDNPIDACCDTILKLHQLYKKK